MEEQDRIKSYITELYVMLQECKESLAIANILNNHLLYSLNTRQILINALDRNVVLLLSNIVKDDKDSINLHKVKNILQNEGKLWVPNYKEKAGNVGELVGRIDETFANIENDRNAIIAWRDQYFAHVDKKWFSDNYPAATSDNLCITAYNMEHLIKALEPLLVDICQLFDVDIQALRIESDAEKFLEIIKTGENYLN